MKIMIILGVIAFAISALLLIVKLLLKIGIDTKCYVEVLKTNTLFFPVIIPDELKNKLLSKPLQLHDMRFFVRCRMPLGIETRIMSSIDPFLIVGTMLMVGGYMNYFNSGLLFCLALLSSFLVPHIFSVLSAIVVWIFEEIYWRRIDKKHIKSV